MKSRRPIARTALLLAASTVTLASCHDSPAAIERPPVVVTPPGDSDPPGSGLRATALAQGLAPLSVPDPVRAELVTLGHALFFDPILSGNRDIACATCHHPSHSTGDGLTLSVGTGGSGSGLERSHPEGVFIARHAPALFNLHDRAALFWDGRVSHDGVSGTSVAREGVVISGLPPAFEHGAASAASLLPVLSRNEMRGEATDNELGAIADGEAEQIWAALMRRLGEIPEYRSLFAQAYPGVAFEDLHFAHASNAIGGFMVGRFGFVNTRWDAFLRGSDGVLTAQERAGAEVFLNACAGCHTGRSLTDETAHNIGLPQLGPGMGVGLGRREDFGREHATGSASDRYRFITPPLRNIELTAPYGHAGQYTGLRGIVAHYSGVRDRLSGYDASQLHPLLRQSVVGNTEDLLGSVDRLVIGVLLSENEIDAVTAYMRTLTDPAARDLRHLIPQRVPSGLPVP